MDIYDELLNVVKNENDLEEYLTHENRYEYLYNFSAVRKNIFEWYDFDKNSTLLEMGAECGALTNLFCDRVKSVVAIDEDEKKCAVNIARNAKRGNLKVWKDIETVSEKIGKKVIDRFDYVTIIGNFTIDKLKTAKELLNAKGKLLLAVENKYGIRYWTGDERPESYSRTQLMGLLRMEGFTIDGMYYPIPDYLFPLEIYSSKNLPKVGSVTSATPSFKNEKILSLDETKTLDMIIKDGKFEEYANSFIIIARFGKKR